MNSNSLIWAGAFVGSLIGGFIPSLWGAGMLDFSSVIFSALGGLVGIYLGYKAMNY